MKYPFGREVKSGLDLAYRVTSVQNFTGGGNYATINYTAPGGVNLMTMGNSVKQQVSWNDRLQATMLQVTNLGNTSLLTLGLYPCSGGAISCSSGNTGNVQSQAITMRGVNLTQSYTYDNLNRLTGVTENSGVLENYGYTPGTGNRYITAHSNILPALTNETPVDSGSFNTKNQIQTWVYDPAGNLKQIASPSRNFTYDAENHQVTAAVSGATAAYTYDH